jgi:hypothetical protein
MPAKAFRPLVRLLGVDAVSTQRNFVRLPSPQAGDSGASAVAEEATPDKRRGFSLPSLLRRPTLAHPLDKSAREERAQEREREKELASVEAAKQAFFETPAGKARLAYKRGHRLFQYELEISELQPLLVPGPIGAPPRETTDPVDVLNSVTVEGWKLVTGKFIHSEMRNGTVGCYLFKRSQKRRLQMNSPWQ